MIFSSFDELYLGLQQLSLEKITANHALLESSLSHIFYSFLKEHPRPFSGEKLSLVFKTLNPEQITAICKVLQGQFWDMPFIDTSKDF